MNQALLCSAAGLPPSTFRKFTQGNGAVSVLDFVPAADGVGPAEVTIDRVNQLPSLQVKKTDLKNAIVVRNRVLSAPKWRWCWLRVLSASSAALGNVGKRGDAKWLIRPSVWVPAPQLLVCAPDQGTSLESRTFGATLGKEVAQALQSTGSILSGVRSSKPPGAKAVANEILAAAAARQGTRTGAVQVISDLGIAIGDGQESADLALIRRQTPQAAVDLVWQQRRVAGRGRPGSCFPPFALARKARSAQPGGR